jgi:hypothetical protein
MALTAARGPRPEPSIGGVDTHWSTLKPWFWAYFVVRCCH